MREGDLVATGKTLNGDITCAAFSPDDKWIAAGGADYKIRVVDSKTFQLVGRFLQREYVNAVTFSPDGQWLAAAGREKVVRLWNLEILKKEDQIQGLRDWHPPLAVSCLGDIAACQQLEKTYGLKIWNPQPEGTANHRRIRDTDSGGGLFFRRPTGCIWL